MDISFIVPTWHYWTNPFKLQPMWEMYYATYLRESQPALDAKLNLNVSITDLRKTRGKTPDEVVKDVPEKDVYFYWIMKSGDSVEIMHLVTALRKKYPKAKHIAGGTHVDMCTAECMSFLDAAVVGPGEISFIDALKDLKGGQLRKQYMMSYSKVPFLETPIPKRDFLPEEDLFNTTLFEKYGGAYSTSVYFSRGCIFQCSYCVYNVPATIQVRSEQMMRDEVEYLKTNFGVKAINLRDEIAIPPNSTVADYMLRVFKDADVIWRGQTTVQATRDQLKRAAESGCKELSIGVETVDDGVMQIINKRQSQQQIRDFMNNAKDFGIKVKMCLIFGLPGEPADIVDKTLRFVEETKPDFVALSGFCPIPGSKIFKDHEKYGIKYIDSDWSKHAHLLYRFGNEEEVGLPFEYHPTNQWGPTFSRDQLKQNIITAQRWFEQRGMTY